jgi:hypothetical protein
MAGWTGVYEYQLAGPASHGRAAPAILSCGHVEPVQAAGDPRRRANHPDLACDEDWCRILSQSLVLMLWAGKSSRGTKVTVMSAVGPGRPAPGC